MVSNSCASVWRALPAAHQDLELEGIGEVAFKNLLYDVVHSVMTSKMLRGSPSKELVLVAKLWICRVWLKHDLAHRACFDQEGAWETAVKMFAEGIIALDVPGL